MRDFSKVAPNIWRSRKFWQLPDDDARLAYLYLLTTPHGNSAGCFDLTEGYGSADMRWQVERYRKAIESLSVVSLIELDGGEDTILIENWVTFNQPTNAKHAFGILTQLGQASSERLKAKRALEYQEVMQKKGFTIDKSMAKAFADLFERSRKAMPKAQPTRDQDQDQDQDQTRDETETRAQARRSPNGALAAESGAPSAEETRASQLLETSFLKRSA